LCCLREIPKPDDAADAVAVAICHAHSSKTSGLLNTRV
jgi:crossover junction endodeoxyribonuclease RuvC